MNSPLTTPMMSEEETSMRQSVRLFCLDEIAPITRDLERDRAVPRDLFRKFGELGLLGVAVDDHYGGAGLGHIELTWVVEEIARVDGAVGLSVAASNSLCTGHIARFGTEDQKRKYLPGLCSGEKIGSWGLTEAGSGSDASGLKTTAVKAGDGSWVLNGRKQLITHASFCDVAVILASTNHDKRTQGISAFVVERGTPGFSSGKKEEKLGMEASDTGELIFKDCRLPPDALVGHLDRGFQGALAVLEGGRIGIGALSVGMAQGALDMALKYVHEREQFSKPLSAFQAIQFKLADMATRIQASRLLVQNAAHLKDAGAPLGPAPCMAKLFASEACVHVCEEAIQIHGGYGYTRDFLVEKFWRDSKLLTIGEGTSEVQRMVIARHLLAE